MKLRSILTGTLALGLLSLPAHAGFHVMQIEEIIGGVGGNANAQAVQLRLRTGGQNIVSASRLKAWDATGANPVLLLDITTNVANSAGGANVLLTTPAFNTLMSGVPGYATDFTLAQPIPASYLSGGKVTFEDDGGTIYWSVAFGAYTGSNLGNTTNDADGNFGAPFASPLPTGGLQGIRFTGAFGAASTTNVADYALTPSPATVRNNAGTPFTVVPEPASAALLGLGVLALVRRRRQ